MSLYDDAKLIMIPSGYKAGTLYSVKPEVTVNDAGYPDSVGDFTVERASVATRINKDGYIESVDANVPLLNYDTIGGCPHLLTQPASQNLIEYPLSFDNSYWTLSGATIEGDASTAGSEVISGGDFEGGLIGTLSSGDETGTWTLNTISPISGTQDGLLQVTSSGTGSNNPRVLFGTLVNTTYYMLTLDYKVNSGTCILNTINKGGGSSELIAKTLSGSGLYTFYFESLGNGYLSLNFDGTNLFNLQLDNISVKEVSGYPSPHADSPYDKMAYKLVESVGETTHYLYSQIFTVTSGIPYTFKFHAKKGEREWVSGHIITGGVPKSFFFNLSTGTIGTLSSGVTATIKSIGGYYECSGTVTTTNTVLRADIFLASADNTETYTGDGTSGIYIFGAQLEEQSSPTTLMLPVTEGSTASRIGDEITGAGDAATFADVNESGVLYAEIAAFSDDLTNKGVSISDGTNDNRVYIRYSIPSNSITYNVKVGGVSQYEYILTIDNTTQLNKILLSYKNGIFESWCNGVMVDQQLSGGTFSPSTLTILKLDSPTDIAKFYGKTNSILVTNELNTLQKQTLTTP